MSPSVHLLLALISLLFDLAITEFEITKADFADAVITGIPESVEYTGESIVLTGYELTLGDTKLVENQDYVVEYTDNKEIGTATVRFIGAGNYSGEKTAAFKIKQTAKSARSRDRHGQVRP